MAGHVVVLGAGLAGLSAAMHLRTTYEVFEQHDRVGGVARSVSIDGFTFDRGTHVFYTSDPDAAAIVDRLLGDDLGRHRRDAWIYHLRHDRFTRFPFQAHLHGLPAPVVKECLLGLFQATLRSLDGDTGRVPADYEEWMRASFGAGIAEHLMIPYARKVWTIPPSAMSYEWIGERVPQPDLGAIVEGALGEVDRPVGRNAEFRYPRRGGIEALPRAFLRHVEAPKTGRRATQIDPVRKQVHFEDGSSASYDALVSSVPLPEIVGMISGTPRPVIDAADRLEHTSIACVSFGVERERIWDGHWLYFYEDEFPAHRVSFPTNLSPHAGPPGTSAVTAEIAYSKHRGLGRRDPGPWVVESLVQAGILSPEDTIRAMNVELVSPAYIVYDHDRARNAGAVREWLRDHDIYTCGRYGEWEHLNMDQCIVSGMRTADAVNRMMAVGDHGGDPA